MPDANPRGSNPKATQPDPSPPFCCDICGAEMFERHCRILCPNCGYQRDCSDP